MNDYIKFSCLLSCLLAALLSSASYLLSIREITLLSDQVTQMKNQLSLIQLELHRLASKESIYKSYPPRESDISRIKREISDNSHNNDIQACQYHGDISKLVYGKENIGNNHFRNANSFYKEWKPSSWMNKFNMHKRFAINNGSIVVRDPGLYLTYAQVYYVDAHDINGFEIHKNDEMVTQCVTMTHTTHTVQKTNTCFTALVIELNENDRVTLRDKGGGRVTLFDNAATFFGLVKLLE